MSLQALLALGRTLSGRSASLVDSGISRGIRQVRESSGAGAQIRTADLRITNALLYQLSYTGAGREIIRDVALSKQEAFGDNCNELALVGRTDAGRQHVTPLARRKGAPGLLKARGKLVQRRFISNG